MVLTVTVKLVSAKLVPLYLCCHLVQGSNDELNVSDCNLDDANARPFLAALEAHEPVCALDMSHNMLGLVLSSQSFRWASVSGSYLQMSKPIPCVQSRK